MTQREALEAAETIVRFLEGRGRPWDWDDFVSLSQAAPELEVIRLRCAGLWAEFPPQERGHSCGPEGFRTLRDYARQLRSVAAALARGGRSAADS